MNYFNKTQIERLSKYENYFGTIIKEQYKRHTGRIENDEVADIMLEATGKDYPRNWACGKCVYNMFEEVGRLYFKSIEYLNSLDENRTSTDNQTDNSTETQISKNKRGRKPKSN